MARDRIRPFVPMGWDFVTDDSLTGETFLAIARLMVEHQKAHIPLGETLRLHYRAVARCASSTYRHHTEMKVRSLQDGGSLEYEINGDVYLIRFSKSLIERLRVPHKSILNGRQVDGVQSTEVERLRVQRKNRSSRVVTEPNSASMGVSNDNSKPKSVSTANPPEIPERWRDLADELAATTHLNRPALHDWAWWEKIDRIYEHNNDLDFLVEIRKMDEWLGRKRTNGLKKDWKRFVANWLSNAGGQ